MDKPIKVFISDDEVEKFISSRLTKMGISEIRTSQHISKKELSRLSGLSTKCIADIESTTGGNPTFKSITSYLNALGYEIIFQKKK